MMGTIMKITMTRQMWVKAGVDARWISKDAGASAKTEGQWIDPNQAQAFQSENYDVFRKCQQCGHQQSNPNSNECEGCGGSKIGTWAEIVMFHVSPTPQVNQVQPPQNIPSAKPVGTTGYKGQYGALNPNKPMPQIAKTHKINTPKIS